MEKMSLLDEVLVLLKKEKKTFFPSSKEDFLFFSSIKNSTSTTIRSSSSSTTTSIYQNPHSQSLAKNQYAPPVQILATSKSPNHSSNQSTPSSSASTAQSASPVNLSSSNPSKDTTTTTSPTTTHITTTSSSTNQTSQQSHHIVSQQSHSTKPTIPSSDGDNFQDLISIFEKISPNTFVSTIPKKGKEKQIVETEILILFNNKDFEKEKDFLKNIKIALDQKKSCLLLSSESVDFENSKIKLIMMQKKSLFADQILLQNYKTYPVTSSSFLYKTELFFLPDLAIYFKNPLLKRNLWKILSNL